jgi:hypothetical protein
VYAYVHSLVIHTQREGKALTTKHDSLLKFAFAEHTDMLFVLILFRIDNPGEVPLTSLTGIQ